MKKCKNVGKKKDKDEDEEGEEEQEVRKEKKNNLEIVRKRENKVGE